jgi:hypothetical protein
MTEEEVFQKAKKVTQLVNTDEFQEIILNDFIFTGTSQFALEDNVDNEKVRDELKARKILNDWIYDIIRQAELLKIDNEGK